VRGLAPGVHLRSYRVFGKGRRGASNYAILKALDRAVADGCDLVNA
jgi:subtilisin